MNISKYNTVSYRFVIVFTAILTGSIQAASITWDGSTDGNWNTGTNWVGDAAPVDTDDLIFTGTASTTTNNDIAANTDFAGIQLTNTTAGQSFTLGGNTIDLTGDIVSTAAGGTIDDTISLGVNLSGAARIINLGANHNLTVSGVISDDTSRDLQMIGSGTLTLSAANTYNRLVIGDFGTRTNGGTVVVENDTAIGGGQLVVERVSPSWVLEHSTFPEITATVGRLRSVRVSLTYSTQMLWEIPVGSLPLPQEQLFKYKAISQPQQKL